MTELNESQRRHLAVSLRHIGRLLDDCDPLLRALSPAQRSMVGDSIERVRRSLFAFADRFGIATAAPALDARHGLAVQAAMAGITADEMRARSLRGYGSIGAETAAAIERECDALQSALRDLDGVLAGI